MPPKDYHIVPVIMPLEMLHVRRLLVDDVGLGKASARAERLNHGSPAQIACDLQEDDTANTSPLPDTPGIQNSDILHGLRSH